MTKNDGTNYIWSTITILILCLWECGDWTSNGDGFFCPTEWHMPSYGLPAVKIPSILGPYSVVCIIIFVWNAYYYFDVSIVRWWCVANPPKNNIVFKYCLILLLFDAACNNISWIFTHFYGRTQKKNIDHNFFLV